ncbi:hypothetical protein AHAS_Ahas01G0121200 [Arachis hypogaea]
MLHLLVQIHRHCRRLPLPRSTCHCHYVSHFVQIRALPLCLLFCLDPCATTYLLLCSNPLSPLRLLLRPDMHLSPLLPIRDAHGRLSLFLFKFAIAASSYTLVLLFSQFALQLPYPPFLFFY